MTRGDFGLEMGKAALNVTSFWVSWPTGKIVVGRGDTVGANIIVVHRTSVPINIKRLGGWSKSGAITILWFKGITFFHVHGFFITESEDVKYYSGLCI